MYGYDKMYIFKCVDMIDVLYEKEANEKFSNNKEKQKYKTF